MNNNHDDTDTNFERIVEEMFKELNVMGKDEEFASQLHQLISRQHKTQQQSFIRIVYQFLLKYSANCSDLRSEGAVEFSVQVSKLEVSLPFI